jgi:hypothetical protein
MDIIFNLFAEQPQDIQSIQIFFENLELFKAQPANYLQFLELLECVRGMTPKLFETNQAFIQEKPVALSSATISQSTEMDERIRTRLPYNIAEGSTFEDYITLRVGVHGASWDIVYSEITMAVAVRPETTSLGSLLDLIQAAQANQTSSAQFKPLGPWPDLIKLVSPGSYLD